MQLILSNDSYYTNSLAKSIIDKFEKILSEDAIVYYEYPFVLDNDNCVLRPSLLIVDKSYSVLLIHCVNDKISNIDDIIDSLDIIESTLMSRFIKSTSTNIKKDRRSLRFNINSCIIVNPDNDFDRDNKIKSLEATIANNQAQLNYANNVLTNSNLLFRSRDLIPGMSGFRLHEELIKLGVAYRLGANQDFYLKEPYNTRNYLIEKYVTDKNGNPRIIKRWTERGKFWVWSLLK